MNFHFDRCHGGNNTGFHYDTPTLPNTPVIYITPVLTGISFFVGETPSSQHIAVSNGTWYNYPTSFTYQWYDSSTPISGATNSVYMLQTTDKTFTLSCKVTAINTNGTNYVYSNGILIN